MTDLPAFPDSGRIRTETWDGAMVPQTGRTCIPNFNLISSSPGPARPDLPGVLGGGGGWVLVFYSFFSPQKIYIYPPKRVGKNSGRFLTKKINFSKITVNFRYDLKSPIPISPDTFSPVIPGEPAGRPRSGERLLLGYPAAVGSIRTISAGCVSPLPACRYQLPSPRIFPAYLSKKIQIPIN